ncbi:MAG: hypothetical protein PHS88_12225, partial [Candidatus Omnitrophica bacterium]|nr:hypothetical protein [Candidatus Omnitrophota bacterium]
NNPAEIELYDRMIAEEDLEIVSVEFQMPGVGKKLTAGRKHASSASLQGFCRRLHRLHPEVKTLERAQSGLTVCLRIEGADYRSRARWFRDRNIQRAVLNLGEVLEIPADQLKDLYGKKFEPDTPEFERQIYLQALVFMMVMNRLWREAGAWETQGASGIQDELNDVLRGIPDELPDAARYEPEVQAISALTEDANEIWERLERVAHRMIQLGRRGKDRANHLREEALDALPRLSEDAEISGVTPHPSQALRNFVRLVRSYYVLNARYHALVMEIAERSRTLLHAVTARSETRRQRREAQAKKREASLSRRRMLGTTLAGAAGLLALTIAGDHRILPVEAETEEQPKLPVQDEARAARENEDRKLRQNVVRLCEELETEFPAEDPLHQAMKKFTGMMRHQRSIWSATPEQDRVIAVTEIGQGRVHGSYFNRAFGRILFSDQAVTVPERRVLAKAVILKEAYYLVDVEQTANYLVNDRLCEQLEKYLGRAKKIPDEGGFDTSNTGLVQLAQKIFAVKIDLEIHPYRPMFQYISRHGMVNRASLEALSTRYPEMMPLIHDVGLVEIIDAMATMTEDEVRLFEGFNEIAWRVRPYTGSSTFGIALKIVAQYETEQGHVSVWKEGKPEKGTPEFLAFLKDPAYYQFPEYEKEFRRNKRNAVTVPQPDKSGSRNRSEVRSSPFWEDAQLMEVFLHFTGMRKHSKTDKEELLREVTRAEGVPVKLVDRVSIGPPRQGMPEWRRHIHQFEIVREDNGQTLYQIPKDPAFQAFKTVKHYDESGVLDSFFEINPHSPTARVHPISYNLFIRRGDDDAAAYDQGLTVFQADEPYIHVEQISEADFINYYVKPGDRSEILKTGLTAGEREELERFNAVLAELKRDVRPVLMRHSDYPHACGYSARSSGNVLEKHGFRGWLFYQTQLPEESTVQNYAGLTVAGVDLILDMNADTSEWRLIDSEKNIWEMRDVGIVVLPRWKVKENPERYRIYSSFSFQETLMRARHGDITMPDGSIIPANADAEGNWLPGYGPDTWGLNRSETRHTALPPDANVRESILDSIVDVVMEEDLDQVGKWVEDAASSKLDHYILIASCMYWMIREREERGANDFQQLLVATLQKLAARWSTTGKNPRGSKAWRYLDWLMDLTGQSDDQIAEHCRFAHDGNFFHIDFMGYRDAVERKSAQSAIGGAHAFSVQQSEALLRQVLMGKTYRDG